MSDKNNGGSAFPEITTDAAETIEGREYSHTYSVGGMTLRDYFAAQWMNGCMASPSWVKGLDQVAAKEGVNLSAAVAQLSYQYADAMLAERQK